MTLALLIVVSALVLPSTHAGGEAEPQLVREETVRYTLFRPTSTHGWASDPCDDIGGVCFNITGSEAFIEIRLQDDVSQRVCASIHLWNHNQTEGVLTGGCDFVRVPIAPPPDSRDGRWPILSQVNVHIEPVDSLILPNPGSLATGGTVTLYAYE